MQEKISAPLQKGQKIGEATYELDGKIVGTVNIVAEKEIQKMNLFTKTLNIFNKWFNLVR